MAAETPAEAFDRGHTAGDVAAQLRIHAERLDKINGSQDRQATELAELRAVTTRGFAELRLAVQGLTDQATARDATAIALAAALKEQASSDRDADDQRMRASEASWVPWARVLGVLTVAAAVVGVIFASR